MKFHETPHSVHEDLCRLSLFSYSIGECSGYRLLFKYSSIMVIPFRHVYVSLNEKPVPLLRPDAGVGTNKILRSDTSSSSTVVLIKMRQKIPSERMSVSVLNTSQFLRSVFFSFLTNGFDIANTEYTVIWLRPLCPHKIP